MGAIALVEGAVSQHVFVAVEGLELPARNAFGEVVTVESGTEVVDLGPPLRARGRAGGARRARRARVRPLGGAQRARLDRRAPPGDRRPRRRRTRSWGRALVGVRSRAGAVARRPVLGNAPRRRRVRCRRSRARRAARRGGQRLPFLRRARGVSRARRRARLGAVARAVRRVRRSRPGSRSPRYSACGPGGDDGRRSGVRRAGSLRSRQRDARARSPDRPPPRRHRARARG